MPHFVRSTFHLVTHQILSTALPITSQHQDSQHYGAAFHTGEDKEGSTRRAGVVAGPEWEKPSQKQRGVCLMTPRDMPSMSFEKSLYFFFLKLGK